VKTKYGFLFSGPVLRIEARREVITMPGINYRQLRAVISIAEVLRLIGFVPTQTCGPQLRGPCPVHASCFKSSRVFSVNLKTNA
jgi:hypothetical protein